MGNRQMAALKGMRCGLNRDKGLVNGCGRIFAYSAGLALAWTDEASVSP